MMMLRYLLPILLAISLPFRSMSQGRDSLESVGIYAGLGIGTWLPDRAQNPLVNPFILTFMLEARSKVQSIGFNFDIVMGVKSDPYHVFYNDSIIELNDFGAGQLAIEYGRELWGKNRFLLDATGGLGFGNATYYNPDETIDVDKYSFLVTPGFRLTFLTKKKKYLQFKVQYGLANYALKDDRSSDLRGNYLMTKLIFGSR